MSPSIKRQTALPAAGETFRLEADAASLTTDEIRAYVSHGRRLRALYLAELGRGLSRWLWRRLSALGARLDAFREAMAATRYHHG